MPVSGGTKLGPYEILSPLGAGGMGEVYKAHDPKLGRDVAIKVLPESLAEDADALSRFEREARAVAALNHPNILSIHDFGKEGGVSYAVAELLEGETLRERLLSGALPQRKAIDYATQIAHGLAAAHEKGIIHRDLKPENVFLTADGRVKILDFGLAKRLTPQSAETNAPTEAPGTEPGTVMGTVGYMSPEQVRGREVDARTDIFSFGAILYEMLSGKRAFKRDSHVETMNAILKEEPPELLESARNVSPALDRIVRHCLEKSPSARFHSAGDVAFDLEALSGLSATGVAAPGDGRVRGRARRVRVAAALPLAAALVAAAFFAGRRTSKTMDIAGGWRFRRLTFGIPASLPSLSPDGKEFVFVRREGHEDDIFLQRVGGENAINLTRGSGFDNTEPAFSPDGTQIAFRSEREGGGIFVMGATGESVRRVADGGYTPSWSPKGTRLVYTAEDNPIPYYFGGYTDIVVSDLSSGKRRVLLKGSDFLAIPARPAWSPDGRRIAFYGIMGAGSQRDIFTVSTFAAKPVPVRLLNDKPLDWAPVWTPDGRFLYFGSDRGGTLDLYRIGVNATTGRATSGPERVALPAGYVGPFSIARDGSRIAFEADTLDFGIGSLPLDPRTHDVTGPPRTILAGLTPSSSLDIAADGKTLLFSSGSIREWLYTCGTDGRNLTQLTDDDFKNRQPRWIDGGKKILFYSTRGGSYQLWEMGPDGGDARAVTSSSIGQVVSCVPTFSGDRVVTFLEPPGNGKEYLAILLRQNDGTYAPGPPLPLKFVPNGSFPVRLSPGGKWLMISSPKGGMIYSVETGTTIPLSPTAQDCAWLNDDLLIYGETAAPGGGPSDVVLYDRIQRTKKILYHFPPEVQLPNSIALSPDGQSLYFITNRSRSDIWLMEKETGSK